MEQLLQTEKDERAVVYRTNIEEIRPLRHRLLRPGLPPEASEFENDDNPKTWHVGVFRSSAADFGDDQSIICCASFMFEPYHLEQAWRLRGMCTDPLQQGRGFGT